MDENLNEEEREKLRLENEIRKIKLELEKGAKFMADPDMPSLPPEIENEFLNYIEQFEKMDKDSPKISIFEKIGKPAIKDITLFTEDEISKELDTMFELLNEHGIHIDSTHEVEEAEMYRFITEDIFKQELFEMQQMDAMMMHFNYEEFYPNDIKDVIKHIEDFIDYFFNLNDANLLYTYAVSELDGVNKWLNTFRDAYMKFDLHSLNVHEVQLEDEEMAAEVKFDISFDAITDGKIEKHIYNGLGSAVLIFTPLGWQIQHISFPKPV